MKSIEYVKKPEGEYGIVAGHFFIDCKCGSSLGCTYGESISFIEVELERLEMAYKRIYEGSEIKHTFYIGNVALESLLESHHEEKGENTPLVLICNGCKSTLPLTMALYKQIQEESKRIIRESMNQNK
jgi:hypothetical protein